MGAREKRGLQIAQTAKVETQAVRVTYTQDWPIYNAVQTHKQERFPELLSELCKGIIQPVQERAGRRNHPLSDIGTFVLSLVAKNLS